MMHQGTEAQDGRAELVQKCHAQAEKLEATGRTVRTLGETVTGMVEATETINAQIADAARRTEQAAGAGTVSMKELEAIFGSLRDAVQELAQIGDAVEEMQKISANVEVLAQQTDLVALNAAVEAARAGRHGATFSVVAEEVRRLATNSRSTSERISASAMDAALAINRVVTSTRRHICRSGTAIEATTQQLAEVTGGIREVEANSATFIKRLRHDQTTTQQLTKDVTQRIEDNSKFLSDMLGMLTGQRIVDVEPERVAPVVPRLQVIDVRRLDEWTDELGHIANANLHTIGDGFRAAIQSYDRNAPTLFVCRSGGRSARAARIGQSMGFMTVMNLSGGMLRWVERGLPSVGRTLSRAS